MGNQIVTIVWFPTVRDEEHVENIISIAKTYSFKQEDPSYAAVYRPGKTELVLSIHGLRFLWWNPHAKLKGHYFAEAAKQYLLDNQVEAVEVFVEYLPF